MVSDFKRMIKILRLEMLFKILPYFLNTWRANSWLRAFPQMSSDGEYYRMILQKSPPLFLEMLIWKIWKYQKNPDPEWCCCQWRLYSRPWRGRDRCHLGWWHHHNLHCTWGTRGFSFGHRTTSALLFWEDSSQHNGELRRPEKFWIETSHLTRLLVGG